MREAGPQNNENVLVFNRERGQNGGHKVRDVLWERKKLGIIIATFPVSKEKKKENGNGESA